MNLAHACNLLLDAALPEWIQLLPAGPAIQGTDGRTWTLDDPAAVVSAFQQRKTPLVIDWEHASEYRAPQGLESPASGWIHELAVRDGQVWGRVEWTGRAVQQIQDKEYRYLSPVFTYRKDTRQIVALTSAGLTNQPNLDLTALNREESPMPIPVALCRALEISEDADEETVLACIQALRAGILTGRNRAFVPPLEKFVPRADYDATLARATNAEQKLADLETTQRQAQIDTLIEKALHAGQIVPATKDYYAAMCQTASGVAEFEKFLAKAPAVIGGDLGLDGKKPPQGTALNAELQQVAALFGNSAEDLKKYGGLQ